MIKEETVVINGHPSNYIYYQSIGYFVEVRKPFVIKTKDLMKGSVVKITAICSVCSKETKNVFKDYYNYTGGLVDDYFCNVCKIIKSEKTCIEKYGVKNPMQTDEVKEILKKSVQNKYGVDHYSKTEQYKIGFKKTCNEKYDVDNPFSNDLIKIKIKKTNNKKYNVNYPQQNQDIRDKSKITNLTKYGNEVYTKTEQYRKNCKKTNVERYGVNHAILLDEYKEKSKKTSFLKYGVDHYSKTDHCKMYVKEKRQRMTHKRISLLLDKNYYDVSGYEDSEFTIYHTECCTEFKITKSLLRARHRLHIEVCTRCNRVGVMNSSIEEEVRIFLDELNIEYLRNDRSLLGGKELDFYLPKYNLAIEFNGLYWHSELYKPKNYHLDKTLKCNNLGVQLLHVWEDDWKNKKNIVKSIIINKLNITDNRIYARKCEIGQVTSTQARNFLNNNHIQGFSSSSTKIGLFYNQELVSLMTFGYRNTNASKEYELIRFCNKINYSVVGASSKLFKYFLKINKIDRVISYSDISLYNGNMYSLLGFEKIGLSKPNYFWIVNGVKKHRFNYTKSKLVKSGHNPDKTEEEIMYDCGYYRIYSCGQEKWVHDSKKLYS